MQSDCPDVCLSFCYNNTKETGFFSSDFESSCEWVFVLDGGRGFLRQWLEREENTEKNLSDSLYNS